MFKIEPFLPEIEKICKKYEAKSLTLFGSALTEEFNPDSSDLEVLAEAIAWQNFSELDSNKTIRQKLRYC